MFLVYHFGQYWSSDLTNFDQLFLNIFLYQKTSQNDWFLFTIYES